MGGTGLYVDFTPRQVREAKKHFAGIVRDGSMASYERFMELFTQSEQKALFRQQIIKLPKRPSENYVRLAGEVAEKIFNKMV
ncbi:MAG: hypothetical protein KGH59_03830 [Candidatus Micrarchaeota archaeon]|nr:hypothetical protein [Candidatus Micrarchaeota archaeon]MDE1804883.1 hypothetical protein [Candidatus Micrarchaeota archaeon]MDE1847155.1 hypothetical protein [Candidatus Micrarchaeota archaeon]